MKYQSTRGNIKNLTFEEALLSGYLSDAGICLPETFPKVWKLRKLFNVALLKHNLYSYR